MRILVGWDDIEEVELLQLYLNVEEYEVTVETEASAFLATAATRHDWDVFLVTTSWPDAEAAFHVYHQLRKLHPDPPIVAATPPGEVFRLARFLTAGCEVMSSAMKTRITCFCCMRL
ncbi:MAG: hypothetical protein R3C12_11590 [Planctomycetaceae bacterium]